MKIVVDVLPAIDETRTNLKSAATKGSSVALSVLNNSGFAVNNYVLVGGLGTELAEVQQLSAITNNDSMTVSTLKFDHTNNTYIQKMLWNQIKVEKSTDNGANWSVVATIDILGDQQYITYIVTSPIGTDLYRTRFYNSQTATYADYSNTVRAAGEAVSYILGAAQRRLKAKNDTLITLDDLFDAMADADMIIAQELQRQNKDYLKKTEEFDILVGVTRYEMPENTQGIYLVETKFRTTDTDYTQSYKLTNNTQVAVGEQVGIHHPFYDSEEKVWVIELKDTPIENITDGLRVTRIIEPVRVTDVSDELNTPNAMANAHVLLYHVLEVGFRDFKDNDRTADKYAKKFEESMFDIISRFNKTDVSMPINEQADVIYEYTDSYNQ